MINIQNEEYFKIAEVAKHNGVKLCIENIFPYTNLHFTALPSEVSDNIREIDHPNARTTIDFSHAYINCRLRNKNFNFKSSYSIGIKIFIIKIYDIFWNTLKKDFRLFRVFTIFLFLEVSTDV